MYPDLFNAKVGGRRGRRRGRRPGLDRGRLHPDGRASAARRSSRRAARRAPPRPPTRPSTTCTTGCSGRPRATGSRWRSPRRLTTASRRGSSPRSRVLLGRRAARSSRASRSTTSPRRGSTPRSTSSSEERDTVKELGLISSWATRPAPAGGEPAGGPPATPLTHLAVLLEGRHHAVEVIRLDPHRLGELGDRDARVRALTSSSA